MPDGNLVGDLETELRKSITAVARDSSIESVVSFLYVLINKITGILTNPPIIDGQSGKMFIAIILSTYDTCLWQEITAFSITILHRDVKRLFFGRELLFLFLFDTKQFQNISF